MSWVAEFLDIVRCLSEFQSNSVYNDIGSLNRCDTLLPNRYVEGTSRATSKLRSPLKSEGQEERSKIYLAYRALTQCEALYSALDVTYVT